MTECFIGFGANQGEPQLMLQRVLHELATHWRVERVSQLRQTAPVGGPKQQPAYANAAILATTTLTAHEAVADLLGIEAKLGRVRRERWGARLVDLDLLAMGQCILFEPDLMVPHPRWLGRRFALQGAVEIGPQWLHPFCQQTLSQLWGHIESRPPCLLVVVPPVHAERIQRVIPQIEWLPSRETKPKGLDLELDFERSQGEQWQWLGTTAPDEARCLAHGARATVIVAPLSAYEDQWWRDCLPWPAPVVRLLEIQDLDRLSHELLAIQQGLSG